jgi:hypothetical protein
MRPQAARHGPGQQGDLGLGDVRGEARATGADLRAIDVERHEAIDRGEPVHPHGASMTGDPGVLCKGALARHPSVG